MSSLDKTESTSGQPELPEIERPGTQEDQPKPAQEDAVLVSPKKSMPGFLKVILSVVFILIFGIVGFGGYIFYLQQQQPSLGSLGSTGSLETASPAAGGYGTTAMPAADDLAPSVQAVVPAMNQPVPTPSQAKVQAMFKQTGSAASSQSSSLAANAGGQQPTSSGSFAPKVNVDTSKTAMEELAYGNGSAETGHLTLGGDDDLHVSVLETVHVLEDKQEAHEQRFKNFDLAATALHKRHGNQITQITDTQAKQSEAILAIKSQLFGIEKALKAQGSSKEAIDLIKATDGKVDALMAQTKKNDQNIKWLSRERLCEAEAKLGITTYSKQCGRSGSSNVTKPTPQPVARPAVVQQQSMVGTVQPLLAHRSNVEVPDTVGVINGPSPQANSMMVSGGQQRPENPCQYASRDWKVQIISASGALVRRTQDGFETMVQEGSSIYGLGRVQLFKSAGYPQYVQFTNGIVCGG